MSLTVLLDSWAWIAFLEDAPVASKIEEYFLHDIIMSTINVAEIQGFLLKHKKAHLLPYITERCLIVPVTEDIAITAAQLKFEKKLHLSDALIFATARANNATLVTGDPHFKSQKDVIYLGL